MHHQHLAVLLGYWREFPPSSPGGDAIEVEGADHRGVLGDQRGEGKQAQKGEGMAHGEGKEA